MSELSLRLPVMIFFCPCIFNFAKKDRQKTILHNHHFVSNFVSLVIGNFQQKWLVCCWWFFFSANSDCCRWAGQWCFLRGICDIKITNYLQSRKFATTKNGKQRSFWSVLAARKTGKLILKGTTSGSWAKWKQCNRNWVKCNENAPNSTTHPSKTLGLSGLSNLFPRKVLDCGTRNAVKCSCSSNVRFCPTKEILSLPLNKNTGPTESAETQLFRENMFCIPKDHVCCFVQTIKIKVSQ